MRRFALRVFKAVSRALARFQLHRLPGMSAMHYAVVRLLKRDTVDLHGFRIRLDANDSLNLGVEPYEPLTVRTFLSELEPGMRVVDVGANIGYYTLLASRAVGARGRVDAFEPEPINYGILRENVAGNRCRNVRTFRLALSDRSGSVRLFMQAHNSGNHRFYEEEGDSGSVRVRTRTLDALYRGRESGVSAVKMDIQGAESAVLAGMRRILRKSRNLRLFMEFWPYGLKRSGTDPRVPLELLASEGYRFLDIDEKKGRVRSTTPAALLRGYRGTEYTNLLCRR